MSDDAEPAEDGEPAPAAAVASSGPGPSGSEVGRPGPSDSATAAGVLVLRDDGWAPPRELVLLLASVASLGCAAATVQGALARWTAPTLGVFLIGGAVEGAIAVGLAIRIALAEKRRVGLYVPGLIATVVATITLLAVFLLSGTVF